MERVAAREDAQLEELQRAAGLAVIDEDLRIHLAQHARALGRSAYDGLGLLAYQARRSLSLWMGADVPIEPLARAVGWPR